MKIERNMNVYAVMERMGVEATQAEAKAMIKLLLETGYSNTNQAPEPEWLELCETALQDAIRESV